LLVFAALFATALLARAVSSRLIAAQSEPPGAETEALRISPRAFFAIFRDPSHGRLLAYLIWIQMAVNVSAPFFTPFMLGPLGLSYGAYAVLTGTPFVARILTLPALGGVAHRAGGRRLLWLGSLGILALPSLWLVSQNFVWLMCVQVASGIAWGAYELATLLVFFDDIEERERTSVLSMFNLANALAVVAGAGLGALLFRELGPELPGYAVLFLLSSALRVAGLFGLRRLMRQPRRSIGSQTRPAGPA
jgi:predicted MFS family arabinose efflux permease